MEFWLTHSEGKTSVSSLKIVLEEPSVELQPMVDYCMEMSEPPRFFRLFEQYLHMQKDRVDALSKHTMQMNKKTGSLRVIFNDYRNSAIARLEWSILFDLSSVSFTDKYAIEFTSRGNYL